MSVLWCERMTTPCDQRASHWTAKLLPWSCAPAALWISGLCTPQGV